MRDGWILLSKIENKTVWSKFKKIYSFKQNLYKEDWPEILKSKPFIVYDLQTPF
ncbi:MAG: DUF2716 domain-containing protein [Promethearchaeota archaeon]